MGGVAGPVRLLIVDDNPFVRRLYETRGRQRADVFVDLAPSPAVALALIAAQPDVYDLIVCDEHLGVRAVAADGVAFVQKLARLNLPVALVTDGPPPTKELVGSRLRIVMRPAGLEELIETARALKT